MWYHKFFNIRHPFPSFFTLFGDRVSHWTGNFSIASSRGPPVSAFLLVQVYATRAGFYVCAGDWTRSLHLCSKHCTCWAGSSALLIVLVGLTEVLCSSGVSKSKYVDVLGILVIYFLVTFQAGPECFHCEEGCSKSRPAGCPHPCVLPCHPGKCPPCVQMLRIKCHCKITSLYVECR